MAVDPAEDLLVEVIENDVTRLILVALGGGSELEI